MYYDDTWALHWGSTVDAGNSPDAPGLTMLRRVFPNPASQGQSFEIVVDPEVSPQLVEVVDARGHVIWQRSIAELPPGLHQVRWDGRDRYGAEVRPSVYFVRLRTARSLEHHKTVRTR